MLRIRRLTQLLLALCACAFISACISLGIYRLFSIRTGRKITPEILAEISNINDINVIKSFFLPFVAAATELRDSADQLAGWGLSFVLIWACLLGFVAIALYRQITMTHSTEIHVQFENSLDRALAGKLELWKIFWGGYVVFLLAMQLIANKLFALLTSIIDVHGLTSLITVPIAIAIPVTLHFIAAILVWQSAKNTSRVIWTYLARLVVVAFTVLPSSIGIYTVISILW
jgi:hypothetical protein